MRSTSYNTIKMILAENLVSRGHCARCIWAARIQSDWDRIASDFARRNDPDARAVAFVAARDFRGAIADLATR